MIYWLWVLIVGAIIGLLAGVITGRGWFNGLSCKYLSRTCWLNARSSTLWRLGTANGEDGNSAIGTRGSYPGISSLICFGILQSKKCIRNNKSMRKHAFVSCETIYSHSFVHVLYHL